MAAHTQESQHVACWQQRVLQTTRLARTDTRFVAAQQIQRAVDPRRLTALGWQSLRDGAPQLAQLCFRAALHHDPYKVSAWLGLSRAVSERDRRREYLQAAIDLHLFLQAVDQGMFHDESFALEIVFKGD